MTQKKGFSIALTTLFVFGVLFAVPLSVRAATVSTNTSSTVINTSNLSGYCQQHFPQSGRVFYDFPGPGLVGHKDPHEHTISAFLSAGTYTVTLFSADSYSDRDTVSQSHEQWFLQMHESNSQIIETGLTTDLPDNVKTAWAIDNFSNIVLANNVTSLTAAHIIYKGVTGANSVQPVCAMFDKVVVDQCVAPTITGSTNITATVGQSFSYTATATSNGNGSTVTVTTSQLPPGLTINGATISGTPTQAGTYTFTVSARADCGATNTRTLTLVVNQQQNQSIGGTCSPSPSQATINQSVTWSASNISGGNNTYTYQWSDTNGSFGGNTSSVSRSYASAGTYSASVLVTSGSQSATIYCSPSVVIQQQQTNQNLTASCAPSSSSVNINQSVQWVPLVYGGSNSYTYSWTGTDSFYASTAYPSQAYYSPGAKYAYLTVTSTDGQSRSVNCTPVYVNQNAYQPSYMTVSCAPSISSVTSGQSVSWIPSVSGAQGPYQYSWYGSDGFTSGSYSPTRAYYGSGTQTASLTVISADGQTRNATCSSVYVTNPVVYTQPLSVSCTPSQTTINTGGSVTWSATAYGGNGSYNYSWNGTDGLYGYGASLYKTYSAYGTKIASVTVTSSDGQTFVRSCTPVIVSEVIPQSCNYLNDYLRIDWQNNPTEVRKLQIFLRDLEGYTDTPVTGIFDQVTFNNTSKFQTKYTGDVLSPWGANDSTGFVYILTKKKVNEIYCQRAFPLNNAQQSEIEQYRQFVQSLNTAGISVPVTTPHTQTNTQDLFKLSGDEVGALFQAGGLACRTDTNGICLPGSAVAVATTSSAVATAFRGLGAAIFAAFPGFFGNLRCIYEFLFILLLAYLIVVSLIHRQNLVASIEHATFMEPSVLVTFIWTFGLIILGALLLNTLCIAVPFLVLLTLTVLALWIKNSVVLKQSEEEN